jgi:hypothetical protein
MERAWPVLVLVTLLGGCGVAGTGAAAGAAAPSAAQQAAQARQTEEQVRQRLEDAARQDAERRRAAEADGQ